MLVDDREETFGIDGGIRMPSEPRGRDHAGAEALGIAVRDHRGQHDRADRHHGRRRSSRTPREHRAGDHAGKAKAAMPVADQRSREIDHPPRDAAMGEEVAGQDEERDRHDLEALDAGEELHRDRFDRHVGQREHEGQHGEAERDRDRHAGEHQRDQQREDHGGAQRLRQHEDAGLLRQGRSRRQERRQIRISPSGLRLRLGARSRGRRLRMQRWRLRLEPSTCASSWCGSSPVRKRPGDLQEAEAHQAGAERDRQVDDPHRRFEVVGLLAGLDISPTKATPKMAIMPVNSAPHSSRTGSPACAMPAAAG